jgi:hypothetical protein
MNHRDGKKRVEAYRETFPAHNQSAVFALEPGKRPLGLEAWDSPFDGAPTWLFGVPHPFGNLRADSASAEALAKIFGIVSFIRRQHFEPFARSAPFPCADVHTWPRPPLHGWGISPTHLNPCPGCCLPWAMMPKSLTYKTRIWAIMLKNFHINRLEGRLD